MKDLIMMARKPISENSIAENVLKWGTGGINVDGCRIETDDQLGRINKTDTKDTDTQMKLGFKAGAMNFGTTGRFPANLILDEEAAKALDEQSGFSKSSNKSDGTKYDNKSTDNFLSGLNNLSGKHHNDQGGASRYFKIININE